MAAYYNEHDAFAAAWLRKLIREGLITDGEVDERSIVDVRAGDLRGFTQCHFFAGIGGWAYALQLAGWPDDRPVWTGSCPCQPFSAAGKGRGKEDARHLWPQFRRLIRQCRPSVVFGEQVASAAGRVWLSDVFADLEALAYRAAGADLCAASVGAFHIRQRLYWVADDNGSRRRTWRPGKASDGGDEARLGSTGAYDGQAVVGSGDVGRLEDSNRERREELGLQPQPREPRQALSEVAGRGEVMRLADAGSERRQQVTGSSPGDEGQDGRRQKRDHQSAGDGEDVSFWSDVEWLTCADGKQRPTQPGIFPLAYGVSGRVGQLRGYGNAIVPQVAAEVIAAYMDATR